MDPPPVLRLEDLARVRGAADLLHDAGTEHPKKSMQSRMGLSGLFQQV
jgi:hypothetical protein